MFSFFKKQRVISAAGSHPWGRLCRARGYRANFDLLWYLARLANVLDYASNAVGNHLKNVFRRSIFENHAARNFSFQRMVDYLYAGWLRSLFDVINAWEISFIF